MKYDFCSIFNKILEATDDKMTDALMNYEKEFENAETPEELAAINSMISEVAEMYDKVVLMISDCGLRLRNKQI